MTNIWLFNVAMERSTIFKNGELNLFLLAIFHGYVK